MIEKEKVARLVRDAVITASTKLRSDQIKAYEKAIARETKESAKKASLSFM
jgi:tartrate dehydratase alpha subunit/fumarate hydratase class I-like protein